MTFSTSHVSYSDSQMFERYRVQIEEEERRKQERFGEGDCIICGRETQIGFYCNMCKPIRRDR